MQTWSMDCLRPSVHIPYQEKPGENADEPLIAEEGRRASMLCRPCIKDDKKKYTTDRMYASDNIGGSEFVQWGFFA